MLVNRRAVRENLYAPEYPQKFQSYMIDLWVRDCYAPEDSRDDLTVFIREYWKNPKTAAKRGPGRDTSSMLEEFSDIELQLMIEIWEHVRDGDPGYIKRLHDAMVLAKKPEEKNRSNACEVAANLYMELVTSGKRPKSKSGFLASLRQRLKDEELIIPKNLHDTLQRIGLAEAWDSPSGQH
jgi:hypothetical protein